MAEFIMPSMAKQESVEDLSEQIVPFQIVERTTTTDANGTGGITVTAGYKPIFVYLTSPANHFASIRYVPGTDTWGIRVTDSGDTKYAGSVTAKVVEMKL